MKVIIFGAGIAGCTLALYLAKANISSVVIEKKTRDSKSRDCGETLPPEAVRLLFELVPGIREDRFAVRCYGIQSCWGSSEITSRSFAKGFPPFALRVNKTKLIEQLREEVLRQTEILFDTKFPSLLSASNDITCETNGKKRSIRADLLVDATGRNRSISRHYTSIQNYDRLIANLVHCTEELNVIDDLTSNMSFVESCEDGWWYCSSPVFGNRSLIRFSDAHQKLSKAFTLDNAYLQNLQESRWLADLIEKSHVKGGVKTISAASTRLKSISGQKWVAIGDAARTVDPLSSQGMLNAIRDARLLSERLVSSIDVVNAIEKYSLDIDREFYEYMTRRDAYYSLETRWPTSPFWQLRRA